MRSREDGLLERRCGRCRYRGFGSAGQRCPSCGAWSEDYGPIYRGRVLVITDDCRGRPETWTRSREWLSPYKADELVREGFGRWAFRGLERWVVVTLGRPDLVPVE